MAKQYMTQEEYEFHIANDLGMCVQCGATRIWCLPGMTTDCAACKGVDTVKSPEKIESDTLAIGPELSEEEKHEHD